jgi:hypothetical protein
MKCITNVDRNILRVGDLVKCNGTLTGSYGVVMFKGPIGALGFSLSIWCKWSTDPEKAKADFLALKQTELTPNYINQYGSGGRCDNHPLDLLERDVLPDFLIPVQKREDRISLVLEDLK